MLAVQETTIQMSLTIAGLILAVLGKVAETVGFAPVSVSAENLVQTFTVLSQIIGLAVAYYGRVRQGDIKWTGARK